MLQDPFPLEFNLFHHFYVIYFGSLFRHYFCFSGDEVETRSGLWQWTDDNMGFRKANVRVYVFSFPRV